MNRFRSSLCPWLVALATPVLAQAQTRDTVHVTPVVTTATRIPLDLRDVPASVTVITGAQLRAMGITSVADALLGTPSAAIAQTGGFGGVTSLFLRGGESRYVKVLIDGVPVNDPGGTFDFSTLTTDNIDHIEILRGPASVLYGADAVAGVIQIFTRAGHAAPRITVSARGGTYGTGDASVAVRGGTPSGGGAQADYSIATSRHQTNGIYDYNNRFTENVVSGLASFAPDAADAVQLSLRYTDSRYHYPTNSAGTELDHNAFASGDRIVLGARLGHSFSRVAALTVTASSDETNGGTTDQPDTTGGDLYLSLDDVRRHSVDARLNLRDPGGRAVATVGAALEGEDENSQSQGSFSGYPFTSAFAAYRASRAGYAQLLWTGVPRLTMVAGARVDDNQQFGAFGTYRAGANYRAATGTRLRASVGTAFSEPTFYENFSTGYVTGNPSLRPEHAQSWEAAVEQDFLDHRLTVGITLFSQQFRDMIDYTGGTTACGFSYCNVARARASGVEYQATAAVSPALSASFGFTHLDTRVLTAGFDTTSGGLYHLGQPLIRRPATSWNAALASRLGGQGTLDARFTYVGPRADRDFRSYPALDVTLPSYLRVDLGGTLNLAAWSAAGDAALTLHVENLTGVTYQSVFNFRSPGRTILTGVRFTM